MLRLRLSTERHYAFKPSPCLKRVELPLNEQIFNTIGISPAHLIPARLPTLPCDFPLQPLLSHYLAFTY
ncbi:hypothetical protein SIL85_16530 [Shewanella oneidensis]|uniref:hypothetical protein n=1 Tax=Shewanella oneidensis TaxID=70863 RepID=UPI001EE6E11F|nr:hypothetical protein [Shewanella oneidensis]MDX5998617.1 hypothetical protein [Shewanella oneidensis]